MKFAGVSDMAPAVVDRHVTPTNDFESFRPEEIEQSIPARFGQQVCRYPNRLAVGSRTHRFTYAELNRAANSMAHSILEQRGESEEPVVL